MGVRLPAVFSVTIANVTIVTTAETVVCITPPLNPGLDGSVVFLYGGCTILIGTTGNFMSLKIRRGTTAAGALVQVQNWNTTANAGSSLSSGFAYTDSPGIVAGQQYCLTAAIGAATANSTVLDVSMLAFVL